MKTAMDLHPTQLGQDADTMANWIWPWWKLYGLLAGIGAVVVPPVRRAILAVFWYAAFPVTETLANRRFREEQEKRDQARDLRIERMIRGFTVSSHLIAESLNCRAVFRSDPEGRCVWASWAWAKLTGMSAEDAVAEDGMGWGLAIHHDERDRVIDEWLHGCKQQRTFELRQRYANGTAVVVKTRPIKDDSGAVIEFYSEVEVLPVMQAHT